MFTRMVQVFTLSALCGALVVGAAFAYVTGSLLLAVGASAFSLAFVFAWAVILLNTRWGNDQFVRLALSRPGRVEAVADASRIILPPDAYLDAICAEAREGTGAGSGFITFVFPDQQVFKGLDSLPAGFDPAEVSPTEDSICRLVAAREVPLGIEDTTKARHARQCASVKAGMVASYLGVPVFYRGFALGALAVTEPKTREWGADDRTILLSLASRVSEELVTRNAS